MNKYIQEINQELQLSDTQQQELRIARQVEQGTLKASSKTTNPSVAKYLDQIDNQNEEEY